MAAKREMKKELCEWSRDQIKEHFDQLQAIVSQPTHVCPKCGRVANRKKWLCQTKKLSGK
jgi:hypothetical protein